MNILVGRSDIMFSLASVKSPELLRLSRGVQLSLRPVGCATQAHEWEDYFERTPPFNSVDSNHGHSAHPSSTMSQPFETYLLLASSPSCSSSLYAYQLCSEEP